MIRIDNKLSLDISRIVSMYNNKVIRLRKSGFTSLPPLVDESALRVKYNKRNLLIRELNQLSRFNQKDAESLMKVGSVQMTRWEFEKIREDSIYASKQITRSLNNGGLGVDATKTLRSQQHFLQTQRLRSKSGEKARNEFFNKRTLQTTTSIISSILGKVERDRSFKANFSKMLANSLYHTGLTTEQINTIIENFENIPAEKLADASRDNKFFRKLLTDYKAFGDVAKGNNIEDAITAIEADYEEYLKDMEKINQQIINDEITVDEKQRKITHYHTY